MKTQFQRNTPGRLARILDARDAAQATGRYLELVQGTNRNTVFPAEGALAADITIGHAVGATAALEAALSGVRSVLLNPYGLRGISQKLYDEVDVVYPSMSAALDAIRDYRAGKPECARLGDWSPIIGNFDPFRDGQAGHRLRKLLDEPMSAERNSMGGAP